MSTIYHAAIPVNLADPSRQRIGAAQFFLGDNNSHVFMALVADTDAPEAGLRAGTVSGTALRADGVTVALEGSKGAEVQEVTFPNGITAQATPCSVTLPQAAFAVPGSLLISIKLTEGTTATTVLAVTGTVVRTETDAAVDPGEILPDLAELQAAAAEALDAADNANAAAEHSVRFDEAQDLTAGQAAQARQNIGAPGTTEMDAVLDMVFTGNLIGNGMSVRNKSWISASTGEVNSSNNNNLKVYSIANNGYMVAKAHLYFTDTNSAAIAFYSSSTMSSETYMSSASVRGAVGWRDYAVEVPNGCVTIAISYNGTSSAQTPTFALDNIPQKSTVTAIGDTVGFLITEVYSENLIGNGMTGTSKSWINATSGAITSSSNNNLKVYSIANNCYKTVRAHLYFSDTNSAAIAFYSGAVMSDETYMASASLRGRTGWNDYAAAVPDGCVMIAISYNGTSSAETHAFSVGEIGKPVRNAVRPKDKVSSVNHRGWHSCPEETRVAYVQSALHGFPLVECDVRFTSDDVPVLLHDSTINRTARNADGTELEESISISSITYAEALEYDFGIYAGSQYAGETILSLEAFLTLCRNLGVSPYIELEADFSAARVQIIADVVTASGISSSVVFISNYPGVLKKLEDYFPANRFGLTPWHYDSDLIATAKGMFNNQAEIFANLSYSQVTGEIIAALVAENIPLELWVCDAAAILAADKYASGFTSNESVASAVLYNRAIS